MDKFQWMDCLINDRPMMVKLSSDEMSVETRAMTVIEWIAWRYREIKRWFRHY